MTLSGWGQIISQYVEANSGTTPKGIEIWNNTGGTLDFSTNNLVIEKGTNGDTPSADFTLSSGTLAAGKVIVIGTSDLQTTTENNGSVFHSKSFAYNGDDALVVKYGGIISDIFGNPGNDPGSEWSGSGVSSKNQNIALLSEITTGDTDGWTDPSERFETISSSPSSGGIDGFGIAPTASIWTGSTSTVWSTASNWSDNSVPTSGDIIIPDNATNNPTISTSDVLCNRLTINPTATLTIGALASINVAVINNNSSVVMQSSSISSAALITSSREGSGTFSYQKYVSSYNTTNDLISAPFTGLSFTNTINNNPSVIYTNPSDNTQYLFGPFDNDAGSYINYDSDTDGNEVMSNAKGYRVGTQSGQTITFTGSMSVGNTGIIANQGSHATYGKWNLIGNPFPSYVDLNHFFDDHVLKLATGIVAIYAYDGVDSDGSSVWTIFNTSSLTDGNGDPIQKYIAPGQAFFVAVDSQQTFIFEHDMKSVDGGDDFIASRMSQIPDAHAVITLQSDGDLSKTDLYFRPSATVGYDPSYDAGKFANESSLFDIYTKISDPLVEDINFAIQTISNDLSETVVIPLGVHTSAGQNQSIFIDDVSLLESVNVYLKDYETGTLTLLNNGAYSFSSDSNLEGTSRFELRLTNTTLGIDSDELMTNFKAVYQNDGVILVGDFNLNDKVEIYDIMGRLTQTHTIGGNQSIEISKDELATGVYLAEINRKGNRKTIKFIIN
jgi:hypothetical protein